jgi:hypothetical protein
MLTKFIEATDVTNFNWGKFAVGRFELEEWKRPSVVGMSSSLLRQRGWSPEHTWVLDLQTGEGAWFRPGGCALEDLRKHGIWVCPMFEPFLTWLYAQDLKDITKLPDLINLGDVPTSMAGYRRRGKETFAVKAAKYVMRLARIAGLSPNDYLDQPEQPKQRKKA